MTWEQMSLFPEMDAIPNVIGLTGYAGSGKDTLANILVEEYGFTRIAFADKIKEFLYDLNPGIGFDYLRDIVDMSGWEQAKKDVLVREYLQNVGVSARNVFGEDFWVKQAIYSANEKMLDTPESQRTGKWVYTDVRFHNEAEVIKENGGQIWRVKRNGVDPVNTHVSESEMENYRVDQIFKNDGTVKDLRELVASRMSVSV